VADPDREQDDRRRFRLSSEVRMGELIVALATISGVATWYVDQRLEPVREQIRALQSRNAEQDLQNLELKRELREDVRRIGEKIDRLIESLPAARSGAR
jgi:hypothetical protein